MVTVNLSSGLWLLALWATLGRIGLGFILPSLNLGSLRPLHRDLIRRASAPSALCACWAGRLA